MPRLSYYMGDLYPNLGGYNDTTAQTVPLPSDVMAIDQDNDVMNSLAVAPDPNIGGQHLSNHYFGLLIVCGTILLLGVRA
jgi:hypothetical protein